MVRYSMFPPLSSILRYRPQGFARVRGSASYADIQGTVRFYETVFGVLVAAEFSGLPTSQDVCASPVFAFHIHEGGLCQGNDGDPFADAGGHYNPHHCLHPYHAGDMPPLFGVNGSAFSVFLTNRFTVQEIIGKTVIVHAMPDDFMTQPSGNAGMKIACGQILGTVRA